MFLNRKWNYKWKMLPPARSAFVLPTGIALGERKWSRWSFVLGAAGTPHLPTESRAPPGLMSVFTHVWLGLGHWSGDKPCNVRKCYKMELPAPGLPWHGLSQVQGGQQECRAKWVRLVPPQGHRVGFDLVKRFSRAQLPCGGMEQGIAYMALQLIWPGETFWDKGRESGAVETSHPLSKILAAVWPPLCIGCHHGISHGVVAWSQVDAGLGCGLQSDDSQNNRYQKAHPSF